MILNDLIRQLTELQEKHGEDIQVRLQCNHGQSMMCPTWCGVSHIELDEYMADGVHEDDLPDSPNAKKVIEIQAF